MAKTPANGAQTPWPEEEVMIWPRICFVAPVNGPSARQDSSSHARGDDFCFLITFALFIPYDAYFAVFIEPETSWHLRCFSFSTAGVFVRPPGSLAQHRAREQGPFAGLSSGRRWNLPNGREKEKRNPLE